jgi:mannose-6-phosphate isomerase-like protein (cupin superfamily)
MTGVVHRPGEGEELFGGRIVIKAGFDQLCITESRFVGARPGAEPHLHRRHADSFYVLEGELAVLVHDEEHPLGPGACVCAPPGVVHGFRSTTTTRFLNFHTPDGRFAEHLRERNRGEPGGFDSVDVPPGSGLPPTDATLLGAGEGERLEGDTRVATIKIGRDELSLIEFELEPSFDGPSRTRTTTTWTRSTSSRARPSSSSTASGSASVPARSWPRRPASSTRSRAEAGAVDC